MSPSSDQFNIWFPALGGGLFVGLLVACLWDILRRKIWILASRFWPGVLGEVGLIHNSLPRTGVEERPTVVVLEVEHLENSIVVCKLRPDLLSEVQSRSAPENGANPFEQPSTRVARARTCPGAEAHRLPLEARVNQESAFQSNNLTNSRDQLVHPRVMTVIAAPSEEASQPHSETSVYQEFIPITDNGANFNDQLLDASSGGAETSREESTTTNSKPRVQPRQRKAASIYYGVRFRPDLRKWLAEIRITEWKDVDKKMWLGTFDTEVGAARAVDLARKLVKCTKKHPFNLPCPELDIYDTEIPSHLNLTDITNSHMFKEVITFIKNECRTYVASFGKTPQKVKNVPSSWKIESTMDNLLSTIGLQMKSE